MESRDRELVALGEVHLDHLDVRELAVVEHVFAERLPRLEPRQRLEHLALVAARSFCRSASWLLKTRASRRSPSALMRRSRWRCCVRPFARPISSLVRKNARSALRKAATGMASSALIVGSLT
jgi:hypothetical protein